MEPRTTLSAQQMIMQEMKKSGENQRMMMKLFEKPLLDSADLTIIFQRSLRTIRRWRKKKEIIPSKIGGSCYYQWEDILVKLNSTFNNI